MQVWKSDTVHWALISDGLYTVNHAGDWWPELSVGVKIYDVIGVGINHAVLFICSDVEGVLKSANGTEYGLASGVFTKDLSKVSVINTGILNFNLGVKIIVAPLHPVLSTYGAVLLINA